MGGKILNYPTKENFNAARKEGFAAGLQAKLKELIEKKLRKGFSVPEIAEMLEETPEVIAEIIEEIGAQR